MQPRCSSICSKRKAGKLITSGGCRPITKETPGQSLTLPRRGAGDRDRTGTGITTHGILSPGRLPISPLRQISFSFYQQAPQKSRDGPGASTGPTHRKTGPAFVRTPDVDAPEGGLQFRSKLSAAIRVQNPNSRKRPLSPCSISQAKTRLCSFSMSDLKRKQGQSPWKFDKRKPLIFRCPRLLLRFTGARVFNPRAFRYT